jgi:hypothetical protein
MANGVDRRREQLRDSNAREAESERLWSRLARNLRGRATDEAAVSEWLHGGIGSVVVTLVVAALALAFLIKVAATVVGLF